MKTILSICVTVFIFSFPCLAQKLVQGYKPVILGTPYHRLSADVQGSIYVYQHFDHLNGAYVGSLAKIDANGNFAAGFNKLFTDGIVGNVHVQQNGKIFVSGNFTTINGNSVPNLVCLHEDGTVDPSFNSALGKAGDFRFQSDGKIIVRTDNGLVRLNTDGSIDPNFSVTGYFYPMGQMEVGPNDYIYISVYGKIYKLKPNGEHDTSFPAGDGADPSDIRTMKVQADGNILIAGSFTSYNGYPAKSLVRLLPDGNVDSNFNIGMGPQGQIFEIVERQNKNILIAGQFTHYNNQVANLVELKPDGSLQKIIAVAAPNWITSVIESADETITIGGEFITVNNTDQLYMVRFNRDYTINTSFHPQITYSNPNLRFLHARKSGAVITGGSSDFTGVFHSTAVRTKIAELNPFGEHDKSYSPVFPYNRPHIVSSLMQEDEKMILGGFVQQYNGPTLVRYNADGTKDNTFNIGAGPTNSTSSAAMAYGLLQIGEILYLGGNFEKFQGVPTQSLVAIHQDGSIAKTFSIFPPETHIHRMARQSDGKLILIGQFPFPAGTRYILRINTDGSVDESFGITSLSAGLAVVKVDDQDRIYLGGNIYSVNGALVNSVVRLLPSGELDASFDTGTGFEGNEDVRVIEILPNGNLAVGGYFNGYNGVEANGFLILDESGAVIPTPLVRFGRHSITTTADYCEGALYLGGKFVDEQYRDVYGTAKINLDVTTIPLAPENLSAEVQSPGVFQLAWTDNSANELAFIIERSENNAENFLAIDTVYRNVTGAEDHNVAAEKKYFYRVKAINDEGTSAPSNITALTWISPPVAQLDLIVTQHSETEFLLTWQGTVSGHNGFIIERSETSVSAYAVLDTVSMNTYSYVDQVELEKRYHYRVAAYNAGGRVSSNEISSIISGIEEKLSNSFYPLPAKDVVYTSAGNHGNGAWYLVSPTGQRIPIRARRIDNVMELDVHSAPSGLYMLHHLQDNKRMLTTRIIISR